MRDEVKKLDLKAIKSFVDDDKFEKNVRERDEIKKLDSRVLERLDDECVSRVEARNRLKIRFHVVFIRSNVIRCCQLAST